ncbi:MAG: U4/U6 small nuclear ribonucleoprotein Prp4, partial [Paramarteilia canceri]
THIKLENRSLARKLQVTTDDSQIISALRKLGEPATLFGESPIQRRDRLRLRMAETGILNIGSGSKPIKNEHEPKSKTVWYHQGPDELLKARKAMSLYSLKRSQIRLKKETEMKNLPKIKHEENRKILKDKIDDLDLASSHICDEKVILNCEIDPSSNYVALSSSSGSSFIHQISLLDVPFAKLTTSEPSKCCSTTFSSYFSKSLNSESTSISIATSYSNSTISLWTAANTQNPLYTIKDNCGRIRRVKFYPSEEFIGYCCADKSWRLFDLNCQKEVLHQEGHSGEVLCIKFHPDGSLVFTGSMDTYSRVCDIRTGHAIILFDDHKEAVTDIDINVNG